jgi:hypothetical protein
MDEGLRLHAAKEEMRIIFSRKGFDSSSGGVPSPIFPDGRMLSLPIPDRLSRIAYADISGNNWATSGRSCIAVGRHSPDASRSFRP